MIDLKLLFKAFLKQNNIYESFCKYIERDKPFYSGSIDSTDFYFNWYDTSEGFNFWKEKSNEWKKITNNYEAFKYIPDLIKAYERYRRGH